MRNCQHARWTCSDEVVETGTHATGRVRLSKFVCPDCQQEFVIMGPQGPVEAIEIPLMEKSKAVEMMRARATQAPAKPAAQKPAAKTQEQRVADAETKILADIGGDGPGTQLALGFFRKGYHASCQACTDLAKRMNEWGASGCRERLDEIVDDILPRAKQWVANTHKLASGVLGLVGAVVDVETPVLRVGIRSAVVEAIDEWEKSQS